MSIIKSAESFVDAFQGSMEYPQLITRHEAVLACEAYHAQFEQWQHIETAPLDTTIVLYCEVYSEEAIIGKVRHNDAVFLFKDYEIGQWDEVGEKVFMWRELPTPPTKD